MVCIVEYHLYPSLIAACIIHGRVAILATFMQLCLCCAHTIVYKKEYLSENELATCTSLTTQGLHTNYLLWKPWHAAQNETWRWDPRHHLFLIAAYRCQPDPRSMTCGWRASHPKCSACSGPAEDRALVWNVKGETLCHVNMITNTWGLHEGYTVATSEITSKSQITCTVHIKQRLPEQP